MRILWGVEGYRVCAFLEVRKTLQSESAGAEFFLGSRLGSCSVGFS